MAQSAKLPAGLAANVRIPFWMRLKAWWEGYDLSLREKQLVPLEMGELSQDEVRPESPEWLSKRLEIMQEIWGKGMTGPGRSGLHPEAGEALRP